MHCVAYQSTVSRIFCKDLQTSEITQNTIATNFNGYTVIIAVLNFRKNLCERSKISHPFTALTHFYSSIWSFYMNARTMD